LTTIAFTRPERRLAESIAFAEAAGFTVLAAPSLEIIPRSREDIDAMFSSINKGDIVVFTSPTSVEECRRSERVKESLKGAYIVALGPGTADALRYAGIAVDTMPQEYSSEGTVKHLSDSVNGKKVFLIRSDIGSRVLDDGLTAAGADVTEFAAYRLKPVDPKFLDTMIDAGMQGKIDVFAFTSPLSARSFAEAAEKRGGSDMLKNAKIAAIGRPTADMIKDLGLNVDIMPERATFEELIAAIKKRICD
jgi:uroporphyrinogen-III synthase